MMNLRVYSRYSGIEYDLPKEQILSEYKRGMTVLSITDHNCVKGNDPARMVSEKYGLTYLTGIAMGCTYQNRNIVVIGYGIDAGSPAFDEVDEKADDMEYHASVERLCETQAMGFHVTENDMWNVSKKEYHPGNWTGKMFAEVIFSKEEYKNHPILQKYRSGGEHKIDYYKAFCRDFYSEGALCYVKINYMDISQAIKVIHENKGKAVLPLSEFGRPDKRDIETLFDSGIDFIDFGDHSYLNRRRNMLFANRCKYSILRELWQ